MDFVIYILIGLVAIAIIAETLKRNKSTKIEPTPATEEKDTGPYISADESDPTQTGRMKAMPIKNAIQGKEDTQEQKEEAKLKLQDPKAPTERPSGAHTSIDHQKIESTETGGFELPDPFSIELSEETKE